MAKVTRDELINQLAMARADIEHLKAEIEVDKEFEDKTKKQFAVAFGWSISKGPFSEEKEYIIPTYSQIFVEVGRLLAKQDFRDFDKDLRGLEDGLEQAFNKMRDNEKQDD